MPGGPAASGAGIGAAAPKNSFAGIAMVGFAAFGGILFGYDTGTISGIIQMDDWLRTFGTSTTDPTHPLGYYLPSNKESLVVSILSAGTFFGQYPHSFIHPRSRLSSPHRCPPRSARS